MKSESGINWVILDVDGVMTDGKLYFTSQGEEIKVFSVYDGLALNNLRNAGIRICVISGRGSDALRNRLNEFSISEMHLNKPDKGAVMEELYTKYGNEIYNAAAIGDDLPDLAVFKLVKYSIPRRLWMSFPLQSIRHIFFTSTKATLSSMTSMSYACISTF